VWKRYFCNSGDFFAPGTARSRNASGAKSAATSAPAAGLPFPPLAYQSQNTSLLSVDSRREITANPFAPEPTINPFDNAPTFLDTARGLTVETPDRDMNSAVEASSLSIGLESAANDSKAAAARLEAAANEAMVEERSWAVLAGDMEVAPDVSKMTPEQLRCVKDLTIRKKDVGEVKFHGEIDLSAEPHLFDELPSIVRLEQGEVVLYPDAQAKPPEGEGLNRPATVTLFRCTPPSNGTVPDEDAKARYRQRIAVMTETKGARFVDYDYDNGIWQFTVEHF